MKYAKFSDTFLSDFRLDDNGETLVLTDKRGYTRAVRLLPYEERPQGEWIPMNPDCRGYSDYFKCSICGAYIYPRIAEKELDYNGCPYCFADMREGAE